MYHNKHIQSLPIRQLLWFLSGASAVIQAVIMSYRHLMGIYLIKNAVTFWATIILSSLIGTIAGFALAIPDIYVINRLNKQFRWGEKTTLRICIQLVSTIIIAIVISTLLTLLSELIFGYNEPLIDVLIRNGMIFPVVNILLMTILEGWIFFRENKQNKEKAEILSRELLEIRFEVLKNQIDPHFMFNNLNVLSALIDSNQSKAQQFIEEFSDLHRYVLDTIEKPVVTVAQELKFIKSYIFLQQVRHNEAIILHDTIPEEVYEAHVPPFSLQIVIENAIKHNVADMQKPLKIELSYANGYIEVKNNIQTPLSSRPSTGLGQNNLMKRYELLSDTLPVFENRGDVYIAKLPLIKEE
jgi:sensor histidine kinase YesM